MEPLTDDDLDAMLDNATGFDSVPRLVAEVRRLRAAELSKDEQLYEVAPGNARFLIGTEYEAAMEPGRYTQSEVQAFLTYTLARAAQKYRVTFTRVFPSAPSGGLELLGFARPDDPEEP